MPDLLIRVATADEPEARRLFKETGFTAMSEERSENGLTTFTFDEGKLGPGDKWRVVTTIPPEMVAINAIGI